MRSSAGCAAVPICLWPARQRCLLLSGLPAEVATLELDDVMSGAAQRPGAHGSADTAAAERHDRAVVGLLVLIPLHPAGGEMVSPRDRSLGVSRGVADVEEKIEVRPGQVLGRDQFGHNGGQAVV